MYMDGTLICDFCRDPAIPDEITEVQLPHNGRLHHFHFHNTVERPCLKLEIEHLRQNHATVQPD
jgi:hypothetical protein